MLYDLKLDIVHLSISVLAVISDMKSDNSVLLMYATSPTSNDLCDLVPDRYKFGTNRFWSTT